MNNSISKKFTLANALILVLSLSLLCFVISAIYKSYTYKNIKKQLVVENQLANKFYKRGIDEPMLYSVLSDSINLVYSLNDTSNGLELMYNSDSDLEMDIDISTLLSKFLEERKAIITVNINNDEYLCSISTIREDSTNNLQYVTISLISTKSIQNVTKRFYAALVICLIVLSVISIGITLILSDRITKPIKKLTKLTEKYASRDFSEKYIADTNDEIQILSESINTLANSLQAHDREKEKLYRNISHELKTPLTAIYGYAEGIKTGVFKDTDEPLDIIMSESLRIKEYAENIILLSKLESDIEVLKFAKYDISIVIENAIKSIESIAILNDIDIYYQPKKISKVMIDDEKIFIALNNILSNCIKYTKDRIDIELCENYNDISITISDNGKGFDKELMNILQSGMSYEKANGSGLGLYIVKEIIVKHKGQLVLGNLPQGGASFQISLPK